MLAAGENLTAHLQQEEQARPGAFNRALVRQAVSQFASLFDPKWGGFGPAPKFPTPHNLIFLLRYAQLADSDGIEGKYDTLTPEELTQVLDSPDAEHFCKWYGITQTDNFEVKNIPNLLGQPEFDREPEGMAALQAKVYAYRLERTPLRRDDS